jgi:hypothetical protein
VWRGLIPGWRTLHTDFPNYYVAARLIREHFCLDRVYDWIWFQRAADHFGVRHQLVGFLGLTPFSAFPLLPLASLPALEAKRLWLVCNLVLLAGSIELLKRQTGIGRGKAWVVALCALIPLQTSLLYGQMHILVLALLVVAYVSHMRGRQIACGCCIAIAAGLKIYPLFFCLYFVIKRRWRALGAAVLGVALCIGLSCLVVGRDLVKTYLFEQLPRLLQGESQNPFSVALTSSSSLFHRLFLYEPELNPFPLIASAQLYAVLYPLWQALLVGLVLIRIRPGFRDDEREALEWSLFLCLLMFLSSAPASYQFVALIAAAVPTAAALLHRERPAAAITFFVLYFLACNLRVVHLSSTNVSFLLAPAYLTLGCGVGLLILYYFLVAPAVNHERQKAVSFQMPVFVTGTVVLCLWATGGRAAWSHLKHTQVDGSGPGITKDGAYLRTSPVVTANGLLYVAMRKDGYRVLNAEAPRADVAGESEAEADQLGFATGASGRELWVESTSSDGSRLVHVISGKDLKTCQIDNGESPALSADGTRLGFLREDRGHGSLWTTDLPDCGSAAKITPPSFDVRTLAAGPNDGFLIGAVYQGKERIFSVSPGATPEVLAEADGPLDSPALSPDGRMLVLRELISHRWQLASFDLSSHARKELSSGDCNVYSPSWQDSHTLIYATDCMRGLGLATLASLRIDRLTNRPQ